MMPNTIKLSAFIILIIHLGTCWAQELTPAQKAKARELIRKNPETTNQVRRGSGQAGPLTPGQTETARQILKDNPDLLEVDGAGQPSAEQAQSSGDKPSAATVEEEPDSTGEESEPPKDTASAAQKESGIVYGRALFTQDYLPLSSSSVPENYVIVPGDQILLRLWGRYNLDKIYTIGDDGYVFIDPLNKQIYLKGTTHRQFKRMIQNTVKDMAGVEGDAKVIAMHPIKINIAGQAIHPGTILIPPYFTFWQALVTSRGPSSTGSVRDIRLVRGSKTLHKLDLYKFLKTGKIPDLVMKDGDLIFFGKIGNTVQVQGLVKRQGLYEIKNSETLKDLIAHAGNIQARDYSPIIQIERIISLEERTESGPTRKIIDIKLSGRAWQSFKLQDGDVVSEKPVVTTFENQVYISGAGVKVPGRYSMPKQPYYLWELIQKAGGFTEGYWPGMEVIRQIEERTKSLHIQADSPVALKSFALSPNDSILTYHQNEFQDSTFISVRGFVRDTISFPYSSSLTLENVLQRSGGLRDGALPYVYIKKSDERNIIQYEKVSLSGASDYIMEKRDEVFTFSYDTFNPEFPVTLLAEGRLPLIVKYSDDLTLEILLHRLNGLPIRADSSQVELNIPDFSQPNSYVSSRIISLNQESLNSASLIVPGLLVIVRSNPAMHSPKFVHLVGEFVNPGSYALKSNKETLMSVFQRANGLTQRGNPYSISIHRIGQTEPIPVSIKKAEPLTLTSFWNLVDGDSIFVLRNDNTVAVTGAVFAPSIVPYVANYSWKDYVKLGAGGTLDTADVKRTYIMYPNGYSKKGKSGWRHSSKVVPGSRIVVPMKPYKPPKVKNEFKFSEFIANFASTVTIFATLVTTYVLVDNMTNK